MAPIRTAGLEDANIINRSSVLVTFCMLQVSSVPSTEDKWLKLFFPKITLQKYRMAPHLAPPTAARLSELMAHKPAVLSVINNMSVEWAAF